MKKLPVSVWVMAGLGFLAVGASWLSGLGVSASEKIVPLQYELVQAELPEVSAQAWLVFDVDLEQVLFSHDADVVYPIASITKLMTASVVYDQADLAAVTSMQWSDLVTEGEAGRFSYGEEYTVRELLFPLLLESSNDAAAALARVQPSLLLEMNKQAQSWQLNDTVFFDTSGLSDGNVSTAIDMQRFAARIYKEYPHLIDISSLNDFYSPTNGWLNNNPLISLSGYQGGKHGFTYAANRTAIAFFLENISGEERTLGYVLLGSDNLLKDTTILRDFVQHNSAMK